MEPKAYREILIFVAGTTPQIITETLYGLIVDREEPISPDEIYVITTLRGKELIQEELIKNGRLRAFYEEFGIEPIPEEKFEIIVISGMGGEPLDDIREASHNEAVGDLIVDFIRKKTGDPASRLHCSLAGGRKTMSFYLGAAIQLFGRPWDRLYHVLVTPEFESHPDFYYKPREEKILKVMDREGNIVRAMNTKDARITLAELPFIRLREKFYLKEASFRDLVMEGQRDLDLAMIQRPIEIDLQGYCVRIGSEYIEMVPVQLMIYCAFLRAKIERCRYPNRPLCLDCTDCYIPLVDLTSRPALEAMAEDYRRIYGSRSGKARELLHKWKDGFDIESVRQNVSKINRTIREGLNDPVLTPFYSILSIGKYGSKRHGVRLEKSKIRIR
ncbi:MAG: CRISPR-associated ring nuclease Csm6 [Candidatus Bathyarchaeia archaeon]